MMRRVPSYLYDTDVVERALDGRPHLRRALADLIVGVPSAAFPHARCSPRQMARVLGAAAMYPHLDNRLAALERALAEGFGSRWLRTKGREQMRGHFAELAVADELIAQGFTITDLDDSKGSARMPEFVASRDGLEVAVEVYAPRRLERLTALTDDLTDFLKHLDRPLDYTFDLTIGRLDRFTGDSELASVDPTPIDVALQDASLFDAIVEAVVGSIDQDLTQGDATLVFTEPQLNLKVTAAVTLVRPSTGPTPNRPGWISSWAACGHAPEALFNRLAKEKVRGKLDRAQARTVDADARVLVVDLTHADVRSELVGSDSYYCTQFERSTEKNLAARLVSYDLIAFCYTTGPEGTLTTHWVHPAADAPTELIDVLLRFGTLAAPAHLVG